MASAQKIEADDNEKLDAVRMNESRGHIKYDVIARPAEIPFEEYLHYAAIQRATEEHEVTGKFNLNPYGKYHKVNHTISAPTGMDDTSDLSTDELERIQARRALRLAGWAAIFFLITTDILGPFNAPIAIAQMGYVPGIILYTVMGAAAGYCGLLLWRLYVHLDSDRYPVRTYSDLAERIFGRTARHVVTVLQSLQLIVNVGVICLSNGQSLYQIVQGPNMTGYMCFSVTVVIWAVIGIVLGQIRSLHNFGWLANASVWMNLIIIFTSMGFVAHSPPNYIASGLQGGPDSGAVVTQLFTSGPLETKVNGMMQMVFAYGGAMIFPEMMAEMRRPMDFYKGMAMAQVLIFVAYLMYGVFIYTYQGQFTLPVAYQGVSKWAWQTVGNVLALVTGIIAAGLYGNIGIKVAYINIVEDWFKGPSLMTKKGRFVWGLMVVIYWTLAFVVGSAIPQVENISSLVAAVCILQFSYTFPPLLRFGYDVLVDAMAGDGTYIPGHPVNRQDTWKDASRWKRGLFGGNVLFKWFNVILFLGFTCTAFLGMWASGEVIKEAFSGTAVATSFGCAAPV